MRADERYMRRALKLAATHVGLTGENPSVGCVLVKDRRVIGEAATAKSGRPHAETQALEQAGAEALGAIAYVTLEPCAHYGQTPPCADALVKAKISRCVIAFVDPDPRVSGKGIKMLQDAGIVVEVGRGRNRARKLMAGWLKKREY